MEYLTIVLAAFSVSLDAMVTGIALGLQKHKSVWLILYIAAVNFAVCLVFAAVGDLVNGSLAAIAGGVIFIIVGIKNTVSLRKDSPAGLKSPRFYDVTLLALGLSVDNAAASLSVSFVTDISVFTVPAIFTAASLLLLTAGLLLAKSPASRLIKKCFWLPGLVLTALGVYKIITGILALL